jgi:hypothetical protein
VAERGHAKWTKLNKSCSIFQCGVEKGLYFVISHRRSASSNRKGNGSVAHRHEICLANCQALANSVASKSESEKGATQVLLHVRRKFIKPLFSGRFCPDIQQNLNAHLERARDSDILSIPSGPVSPTWYYFSSFLTKSRNCFIRAFPGTAYPRSLQS